MGSISTADYVVLAFSMGFMVAIGAYFFHFIREIRAYYAGGNQIPWWTAGISYYMASFSTYIFVAYAGRAYKWGWPAVTMLWAVVPAILVGGLIFAHLWRRAGIITPVEFLETRYNLGVRQLFVWARMPVQMIDCGARIFALAFLVHTATGIGLDQSIVACGLVTLTYTLLGGLWAVTVADVMQFIVLLGGTVVMLPTTLCATGGWGAIAASLPPDHLRLFNEHMKPDFWVAFLAVMIAAVNSNWALVQRFYCVRDERAARRVGLLAAVLYLFTMPLFMLPCLAARALVPEMPHDDQAFVAVAMKVLPPGMMGMMLAGMFAATMSTLDSEYNVLSSVLTRDVYQRLFRQQAGERELMFVARAATAVAGGVPIILAFVLIKEKGLFDTILATFGVTAGPLAVPVLGGLVYRRGTSGGAVASVFIGMIVGAVLMFAAKAPYQYYSLGSIGAAIVVFVVVSRSTRADVSRRQPVADFFARLARPVEPPPPQAVGGPSPFGIVGAGTLGLGATLSAVGLTNDSLRDILPCVALGGALLLLGAGLVLAARRQAGKAKTETEKDLM